MISRIISFVVLILFFFLSTSVSAQIIHQGNDNYSFEDKLYSCNELGDILKANDRAFSKYNSHRRSKSTGFISSGFGGVFLIVGLINGGSSNNQSTVASNLFSNMLFVSGIAMCTVGVVLISTSKSSFNDAIDIFNSGFDNGFYDKGSEYHISLGGTSNGIGFMFTF